MQIETIIPELAVTDMEESIRFYTEALGFEVEERAPADGAAAWVQIRSGESRMMLQIRDELVAEVPALADRAIGATSLIVIQTTRQAVKDFVSKRSQDIHIVMPLRDTDYGSTECAIQDPDGYVLLLAGR